MKIISEFKQFAIKGNMMDIAIGIIIGTAFNEVIDVLIKKVILPPFTLLSSGIQLEDRVIVLREGQVDETGAILVNKIIISYGLLIETFLDFFIIGITLFTVVKAINIIRQRAEDTKDTTVETPKNIQLLSDISELLEKQNELLAKKKEF